MVNNDEDPQINNAMRSKQISFAAPVIENEDISKVIETLQSGWLTTGELTNKFELSLSNEVKSGHAIGTSNCTSALYLAYRTLEINGEFITTPMTFATTVSSGIMAGAKPVLADIRSDTLTLDPESVKNLITNKTEAIVPVHYAGQGTDMNVYLDLAEDHDLSIIEDAAHGLGGTFNGVPLGTMGDVGCYSFYATKSITTGEGGALLTDYKEVNDVARRLRLGGINQDAWNRKKQDEPHWYYDVSEISGKFNMTDIQASIGLTQLNKLDRFISKRQELAKTLDKEIGKIDNIRSLNVREEAEHARHLYPIILDTDELGISRLEFYNMMNSRGIETSVHYIPIHQHTAFKDIEKGNLSTTNKLSDEVICLPLHPLMDMTDVHYIAKEIKECIH